MNNRPKLISTMLVSTMLIRVILVASFLSIALPPAPARGADASTSALVQLAKLQKGQLPLTITAFGIVQPKPSAMLNMMAPISVRVGKVYVQRGQTVDKGAALVELLPSAQTAAAWQQALTAYDVARQLVSRTRRMRSQQLATAQQLADAQKSESDAQAQIKAYRQRGADGPHVLHAPYRATVTDLAAQSGALVAEGAPLLVLARPEGLVLNASLRVDRARRIAPGNKAIIAPVGEPGSYAGKVLMRGTIVDASSGLVPIQISVPSGKLMPGQSANATITSSEVSGYVVPHKAILVDDQGRPYVVQARAMRARLVHVSVLGTHGDRNVITGNGLDASEPLVLSGNHQLQDGMRLRVDASAGKPR